MASQVRQAPDGYTLGKRLHATSHSEVYEAVRDEDGAEVVLKGYLADRSGDARTRAQREFDAMRRAASPGVPRALALDRTTPRPLLVVERVPGLALLRLLDEGPIPIEAGLAIAAQVAETLAQLHAVGLLHKDVSPGNVLVEPASWRTWLLDFGLAAELGAAAPSGKRGAVLEGTLRYVAPEQTCWLNRGCDARSDLYSLGATLYHAWTGRPPFNETDALELIHAHLAKVPRSPCTLRPDLPEALAQIVLKLLRKEPEERYQSARALHADLATCRTQLESLGHIDASFELGSGDSPARPRFARRLYGRQRELALLRAAHARAASGRLQLVMLSSEPGLGKSALVDQLRPALVQGGGYLGSGRFDPFRERPYAGWAAALGAVVQQLLLESDACLERWRRELGHGLGNIAQSLVDLVPDLKFVVGDVPPVPPLGPRETQARLSLALQRFVSVLAQEHPLVLFLDDLQWSDADSRYLLEDLLANTERTALLLIGAYRSGEVAAAHPLAVLLDRTAQRDCAIERIELEPLGAEAAVQMLAEALERAPDETRSLAACVARKTGNSPLLIQQFVLHMHALGLIRFARGQGWTWNDAAIVAADIPDGAVALMVAKLERLDPAPRELIEFASCVGDPFDVALLSELSGRPRDGVEPLLFVLADEGLIAPAHGGFRFVHDRIREAAQSLLPAERRARLHYDAGRLLFERTSEAERPERVFEIVEHLNRGRMHMLEPLRLPVAELNLSAGKRALAAGAGTTAGGYLAIARELFMTCDWEPRRALGFDLYLRSADSAFQSGEHDHVLALLDELDRHSPTRLEFAQIASKRMQVFALVRQTEECARYALEVLRQLGVRWPLRPSRLRGWLAMQTLQWMLYLRGIECSLRAATHIDSDRLALLVFLHASVGILTRLDVRFGTLVTCLVLRGNLRHGAHRPPAYTLAAYAVYVQRYRGASGRTRELAQQALALSERAADPVYHHRTKFMIHALLEPWLLRRRQALEPMDHVAQLAGEVGDREFAHYARFLTAFFRVLAGAPVGEGPRCLRAIAESARSGSLLYREAAAAERVCALLGEASEDAVERQLAESDAWFAANPGDGEPYIRTLWLLVLCVRGQFERAFAQSQALGERLFRLVPFVHVADHTFYRGLAAAALATSAPAWPRQRYLRALARSRALLRRYARQGPDFAHMLQILEAEQARLRGRSVLARSLYEQGAQRAAQQEFPHHAALAHERRARMLVELRRETEAAAALGDASSLYHDWGALAKSASLIREQRALAGR